MRLTSFGGESGTVIQKAAEIDLNKAVDTDWFASNIEPTNAPSVHRITLKVETSTVVNLQMDGDGATNERMDLNGGNALTAHALYTFDIPIPAGFSYNIQHKTGTQNVAVTIVELQSQTG